MRKLIVQQWSTVDAIVAEGDGGLSYVSGEPFDDSVTDDPFQNSVMASIDAADTLLLGATTYHQSASYWPDADEQGEHGRKLNNLTKYVASSTLKEAPWGRFPAATVTSDPVATVRKLKTQDGKDIVPYGSLTLMRTLFDAGLVDEVLLRVCPSARGTGTRIFERRQELRLLDATPFANGIVLMRYAITR